MQHKMATGYLGGRLQELADRAYIQNGRWMVSESKTLQQAIDETLDREQTERRTDRDSKDKPSTDGSRWNGR